MGTKTGFEDLLSVLQDEHEPIPIARLSELSDLDRPRLEILRSVWNKISCERRRNLLEELGRLADSHIELTFEKVNRIALSDSQAEIRKRAIENLWECEAPDLVDPLLSALTGDPASEVRAAAATALGPFVFLGEVEDTPANFLHQVEDALLEALAGDDDLEARRSSLESLGYSSRPEVPPLIEQAYASDVEKLKKSAILAMGRSADKPWGRQVMAELESPAPSLRYEAARAAGELDLQDAVPSLIDLLEDVDDRVRIAAIWSLGQLGGEEASTALNRLLQHAQSEDETDLVEQALENLAFVDGTRDFLLFDLGETNDSS